MPGQASALLPIKAGHSIRGYRYKQNKLDPDICKIKDQEAKEFVIKMKKEKEERIMYFKSIEEKEQLRLKKERQMKLQLEQQLIEERLQKKKEDAKKRLEEYLITAEERKRSIQERLLARVVNNNYLYKQWEKSFESKLKEEQHQKLEQSREHCKQLYKPLNHSDFIDHMRKLDTYKLQKQCENSHKFKEHSEEHHKRKQILENLKTKTSEKVMLMLEEEKEKKVKTIQERMSLQLKMRAYSHIIKETRVPSISNEKVNQRMSNISKLRIIKRRPKTKKELPDYLHTACNVSIDKSPSDRSRDTISDQILIPKFEKKMHVDYLKQRRETREKEGTQLNKYDWHKDLNSKNLSYLQKYDRVIDKAKAIEEQAKKEETILKAKGGQVKDFGLGEHISDMLIDAIKAKLAILGNL